MNKMKWKKIIIKDKFQTENGTVHNSQRIFIALCNTETGEYLISPFSDFLKEFADRKSVTVSLAADIITRFYAFLDEKKMMKAVSPVDLEYFTDKEGHRILENPFTGRFIEGERNDAGCRADSQH